MRSKRKDIPLLVLYEESSRDSNYFHQQIHVGCKLRLSNRIKNDCLLCNIHYIMSTKSDSYGSLFLFWIKFSCRMPPSQIIFCLYLVFVTLWQNCTIVGLVDEAASTTWSDKTPNDSSKPGKTGYVISVFMVFAIQRLLEILLRFSLCFA